MNKNDRLTQALLVLICILLLWGGITAMERIRSLENQVMGLQGSLSRYDLYHELQNLRQSLREEIEQGASIVASSESTVEFNEGTFDVRMTIVPKAIEEGEEIYLSLGDQRVRATTEDGKSYTAAFSLPPTERVEPYISIESDTGKRQEKLPDVQFRDFLGFGVDSRMEHESNTLDIRIFALYEESREILSTFDDVALVFHDETKKEIGRMPFTEGASEYDYEDQHFIEPGTEMMPYHLTIPSRYYGPTRFTASVVVSIGEVTLHADEVYTYENNGVVMEGIGGGEFGISFGD